jgi:hypothetical protein
MRRTAPGLLAFADPARIVFGTDFPFTQAHEVTFFARQLDDLPLDTVCTKRSHEQTQPRCFRDFATTDLRRPRTGCKAQRRTSGRAIVSDEAAHPR